ncbi:MAG: adenylosuccinate lyase [Phycisphaerales bacterium]|jgi:adenylosuccinate lyase|nr:adenylosuccinate lyase [Phycisphaerales bacterium]
MSVKGQDGRGEGSEGRGAAPSGYDTYQSPLASRNASRAMLRLWSPRHKFNTWRRIWLGAAQALRDCGVVVSYDQVDVLEEVVFRRNPDGTHGITDDEIRLAEKYERELRHDVMAHVHALGDACPEARPIIHLGMTSQDVVCNADLMVLRDAMELVRLKVVRVMLAISEQATSLADVPTLGLTHYQPAQPVTVGRRLALWAHDLGLCETRLDPYLPLRGLRGATGTQASFLKLSEGHDIGIQCSSSMLCDDEGNEIEDAPVDEWTIEGVDAIEHRFCRHSIIMSVDKGTFDLTGQTYPRVVDTFILADLASVASVLHKIATDIRLLCNRKELDEPFEDKQIGSSAMPYKRNPMRCERICGLTRFVMNLVGNAYDTAATQWLERTLDDSSNRRLSLPEAFLALDGALDLMHNVASGLVVHEAMVRKNLMAELPFLATENILMACVKLGADRQDYHERIRVHAQAAGMRVKQEGLDNDLLERLKDDPAFRSKARGGLLSEELDWDNLLDPMKYVGRSVEQTERFIAEVIEPMRERYADELAQLDDDAPRV